MTGGHENQPGEANAAYVSSATKVTTGGQIGAPTAAGCCGPPTSSGRSSDCPWGDWEHNHHYGPDDLWVANHNTGIASGAFAFHSGTGAAPKAAFIKNVKCDDPGWCVQARPAPDKQIFWEGTGVFDNLKKTALPFFKNCTKQPSVAGNKKAASVHYYTAHVGDFGEPAGQRQKPIDGCSLKNAPLGDWSITCDAVAGVSLIDEHVNAAKTAEHPLCEAQDCSVPPEVTDGTGCPDWYDIEIHCTDDPGSPIAYKFGHFILEGNFQLHPPVGSSCQPE